MGSSTRRVTKSIVTKSTREHSLGQSPTAISGMLLHQLHDSSQKRSERNRLVDEHPDADLFQHLLLHRTDRSRHHDDPEIGHELTHLLGKLNAVHIGRRKSRTATFGCTFSNRRSAEEPLCAVRTSKPPRVESCRPALAASLSLRPLVDRARHVESTNRRSRSAVYIGTSRTVVRLGRDNPVSKIDLRLP
jgi:hypothetical protein